ncbi:MAG: hypothetical protein OEZ58_03280 [Gammaproteobacteria bacterium]|nr:hypothetical protein [Gammaproteobacteria bacterium]MDH5727985.1 hypothetical protein [Gammaproteobacteria bacterium]
MTKPSSAILLLLLIVLLSISACTVETIDRTASSLNTRTNAFFFAYRDAGEGVWEVSVTKNSQARLDAQLITVKDAQGRYELVFVCHSRLEEEPHKIFYYRGTVRELNFVEHICKKPKSEVSTQRVFGEINGVESNQQRHAVVSLSSGDAVKGQESFALEVPHGKHDTLSYMGSFNAQNKVIPEQFYIQRGRDFSNRATAIGSPLKISYLPNDDSRGTTALSFAIPSLQSSVKLSNIENISAQESWSARAGFLSENGTYLTLNEAKQSAQAVTQFDFIPIPEYIYDANLNSVGLFFQKQDEGHEVELVVRDARFANNPISRRSIKAFKRAESISVDLYIPQIPNNDFVISAGSMAALGTVNSGWRNTSDPVFGQTKLYRIDFTADSAIPPSLIDPFGSTPSKVVWSAVITPKAIDKIGDYNTFDFPLDFNTMEDWNSDWNIANNGEVIAEFHSFFSPSSTSTVLTYLSNRRFYDKLQLAEVIQRRSDTITPPL